MNFICFFLIFQIEGFTICDYAKDYKKCVDEDAYLHGALITRLRNFDELEEMFKRLRLKWHIRKNSPRGMTEHDFYKLGDLLWKWHQSCLCHDEGYRVLPNFVLDPNFLSLLQSQLNEEDKKHFLERMGQLDTTEKLTIIMAVITKNIDSTIYDEEAMKKISPALNQLMQVLAKGKI